MKIIIDLTPAELICVTEELSASAEDLEDMVNQYEAAAVPQQHPELRERKFQLETITKVLGQMALGGIRSDTRRG